MTNPLVSDLAGQDRSYPKLWEPFHGARIFMTGGTGFFGGWLLESFLWAKENGNLDAEITVLTRDPSAFEERRPRHARGAGVTVLQGDVLSLVPPAEPFTHVIHCAAPVGDRLGGRAQGSLARELVEGTRKVMDFARGCGAQRVLLASSGAVYGSPSNGAPMVSEDDAGARPGGLALTEYGQGKKGAEELAIRAGGDHHLEVVIARCFAFAGPYLPLDGPYAIGNFVRDALRHGPIEVKGDGTSVRSFMYGADLATWLWTLLADGRAGRAYNVGSEHSISISGLAHLVVRALGSGGRVEIAKPARDGSPVERYVPSTKRARTELGLMDTFDLETSICRMAEFASHR